VRDIAQAASSYRVDVVGLSFSVNMNPNQIVEGLAELRLLLPAHMEIWAGGQSPALRRRSMEQVRVLQDLSSIETAVKDWCER
jgi:hypothetical protein